MRAFRFASVLAALAAVSVLAAPAASAATAAQLNRALKREANRLINAPTGPPGIAITVQRGRRKAFISGGQGVAGSKRRIRATDRMRIASAAKAHSGAIALQLVERGQLKLSDTIGQRLPNPPAAWRNVTLRQLLNHTSGVPNYTESPTFLASFQANPRGFISPRGIVDFVADDPLLFGPGSRYRYSNTDNIVVGLIAQAVTGRRYSQLLSRLVLGPLRLRRTSLPSGFAIPGPYIHGYDVQPNSPLEDISTAFSASGIWASGGIISTPDELHRFMRAYGGTRVLGRRMRREQLRGLRRNTKSDPPGPGVNSAGLALFRYRMGCGTVYGHTGSFPGYTQFAAVSRGGTRSVAVAINIGSPEKSDPALFNQLRKVYGLAACYALASS